MNAEDCERKIKEEDWMTQYDPFPKWKWKMDYLRERTWHPADFWDLAEKAWREKFESNVKTIDNGS